ncbi:MAG: DNA repair protein RecN [Micrococcaceae bacterium]
MIEEINIRDLGVISQATLPLGPGFTAVTGETGAGKTMVVSALGLIMGQRAKSGTVRSGAKLASVEANILVSSGHDIVQYAEDHDILLDEAGENYELILARTVNADGRSKAQIGGRNTPVGTLAELSSSLVEIHGQSDQMRLRSASSQRDALDRFAGASHLELLKNYREKYSLWVQTRKKLKNLRDNQETIAAELEELQEHLEFYDSVSPTEGEDDQLKAESIRLNNVEELRAAAYEASQALVSDSFDDAYDVSSALGQARKALDSAEDDELQELLERLEVLNSEVSEVSAQLTSYVESLDEQGPQRLEEVESRRAKINTLINRHGPTLDDVFVWEAEARKRLDELNDGGMSLEELEEEVETLELVVQELASKITQKRNRVATSLSHDITEELHGLMMADATMNIAVTPEEISGHGADKVEFLLSPHAGSSPIPVSKGASGGELSRVMLALEVVLAGSGSQIPTFVFDEIDAGVGGKAAVQIGKRLQALAQNKQVICVTHLPQVAAYANNHVQVVKTSNANAGVTSSDVQQLEGTAREREIARMLSGHDESTTALQHARELLESAK